MGGTKLNKWLIKKDTEKMAGFWIGLNNDNNIGNVDIVDQQKGQIHTFSYH